MFIVFSNAQLNDLKTLADILNHYVVHSTATFHKEPLSVADMHEKIFFDKEYYQSFVIKDTNEIIGYCAISPWKKQEAYRHTAEINIYMRHDFAGKGVGTIAIPFLEKFAKDSDIQTLIAGLCSENVASQKLFEKNGYVQCATFKNVGRKFNRLLDVIYLQKQLKGAK